MPDGIISADREKSELHELCRTGEGQVRMSAAFPHTMKSYLVDIFVRAKSQNEQREGRTNKPTAENWACSEEQTIDVETKQ